MSKTFTLTLTGDVMLGRLVDQLFPTHIHNPQEASIISTFVKAHPSLKTYSHRSPWGSTLPLLHNSDLTLINLETAATTVDEPWPDKVFNYRMHPANLAALQEAKVNFVNLANNHTLDFGVEGLLETIRAVKELGVAYAGVGDEPGGRAVLSLPKNENTEDQYQIHVYSGSDHPRDWASIPLFHYVDYSRATRAELKRLLTGGDEPALKIFSVHWGPNYAWRPGGEIVSLAHFLVDECGVDIVHGHSAHHVQGVEVYRGRVIIYGCGDFVDDYALNGEYRNDLGAVWRVVVGGDEGGKLGLERLEVFPTRCRRFVVDVLGVEDQDHAWVRERIGGLSREFGTVITGELGREGQIVVDLRG
ncbi:hypothetical protein BDV29DRAFT_197265 [Aspergillus leporis]|uniref:Capsule synthesis protein CapA domain-containing protein n=1 Tax=Aspergillus leporis TaxID=41062 RepID=A0A5N5XF81_9EURO|nr:hypothetical protein BDV29DRAFT_197265 [Aspergillus leporis]